MSYVILVEVDNKRAFKLYKEAYEGITTLWPGIEAYCAPLDKAQSEMVEAEMKAYYDLANRGLYARVPYHLGYLPSRLSKYESQRLIIKRGMNIASIAISPYKITEDQALLLADIECGDWIRRIEDQIISVKP